VNDVKEYSIFNLNNPYSNNLMIPMELKCMVALRMLGRDLCFDEKLYSKYVYIPKGEELKSILELYEM